MYRVAAHVVIALVFGYLYLGVGSEASTVLGNYVYLYGSMLLVVYTGKMSVTLSCEYLTFLPDTRYPIIVFVVSARRRSLESVSYQLTPWMFLCQMGDQYRLKDLGRL